MTKKEAAHNRERVSKLASKNPYMNRAEIARALGLSYSYVSNVLSHRKRESVSLRRALETLRKSQPVSFSAWR